MKHIIVAVLTLSSSVCLGEALYSFADVNVDRLTWTDGTKLKSRKQDFTYLEVEGGSSYPWGEIYGFFDFENPGGAPPAARTAAKGSLAYRLDSSVLSVYGQVYNFSALGFNEQNKVYGLELLFAGTTWWFKPFLGFHDVVQTFYTGANGYMLGATLGVSFHVAHLSFLFTDWHEFEFGRNAQYAALNGGLSGHNGAAALWWNATMHWATGFQWRYAINKLGTPGDQGAEIYTLKYNF